MIEIDGAGDLDDDGEIAWHRDGADVPPWLLAGWLAGVVTVLVLVATVIL